jgi:hypothetical protein
MFMRNEVSHANAAFGRARRVGIAVAIKVTRNGLLRPTNSEASMCGGGGGGGGGISSHPPAVRTPPRVDMTPPSSSATPPTAPTPPRRAPEEGDSFTPPRKQPPRVLNTPPKTNPISDFVRRFLESFMPSTPKQPETRRDDPPARRNPVVSVPAAPAAPAMPSMPSRSVG